MITGKKIHNLRSVSSVLFGASWWWKPRRHTLNSEEQLWWGLEGESIYIWFWWRGHMQSNTHLNRRLPRAGLRRRHKKFSSVQLLSPVWLFATPCTATCEASLSITNSQSLLKLISIELVMSSNYPILCRPLLLLPSIFPSITVFSNESVICIRWPKYWSFSFSISPSNEYSGLISFL